MRFLLLPCFLAISLTAAFPFAMNWNDSQSGSQVSGPPSNGSGGIRKAACIPHLFWNTEKEHWAIQCNSKTTCCVYEVKEDVDGNGSIVWCDCKADLIQPSCCHTVLRIFPNDKKKDSVGEGHGECYIPKCDMFPGPCGNYTDFFRFKCESLG